MSQAKYYKVTDMEEKVFQLVEISGKDVAIASKNSAAKSVSFEYRNHFSTSDFLGKVTEIDAGEHSKILIDEWGYEPPQENQEPDIQNEGNGHQWAELREYYKAAGFNAKGTRADGVVIFEGINEAAEVIVEGTFLELIEGMRKGDDADTSQPDESKKADADEASSDNNGGAENDQSEDASTSDEAPVDPETVEEAGNEAQSGDTQQADTGSNEEDADAAEETVVETEKKETASA